MLWVHMLKLRVPTTAETEKKIVAFSWIGTDGLENIYNFKISKPVCMLRT